MSSLDEMLAIFDVAEVGERQFEGTSDGGTRRVVDGSQVLAQSIVAASKTLPDKTVRSAHAMFTRAVRDDTPILFDVEVVHAGRTFASAVVTAHQGGRPCVTTALLLDAPQPDVIRHTAELPSSAGVPADALPYSMPLAGRELRLVGVRDANDPDEVGPPVLDAWLHYATVPTRHDLAKALLAHFTGHLSISTTMRAHAGVGTAQAHDTLSTGVITITIAFHEPVAWSGWLLYHHESTAVGAGMSHVRGQIFTEDGTLVASFTQEGMIRHFVSPERETAMPVEARL